MDEFKPDERIEAVWCYDSETGEKLLVDLKSGQVIGKWIKEGEQDDGN